MLARMDATPLDRYEAALNAHLDIYCNPDHPGRWLRQSEKRDAYAPVRDACDPLHEYLIPRIGKEETQIWFHLVLGSVKSFTHGATRDRRPPEEQEKQIEYLRYLYRTNDIPYRFRQLREVLAKLDAPDETPIPTNVALQRFNVSRSALLRAVSDGSLQSVRRAGAPRNASHQFRESDLAARYQRRG